jgi:molecular chaperone DnaK
VPPTRQALVDAHRDPSRIDLVILAGNGTKMPVVRRLAAELTGSEPYRYLDADLVTALGAAIQAGMIQGTMQRAILLDVLPLSLGVETKGGLFARIIPRNTTLPASASQVFSTASDGQAEMQIEILQGERDLTSENVRLGRVELDELVPAPRGTVKVEVAFEVDTDGIVNVRATDLLAGRDASARFVSTKQLDPEEIARLVAEADALADDDRDERQQIQAGIEADSAIDAGEKALESLAAGPGTAEASELDDAMWQIREILADGSVEELRTRCEALRRLLAAVDAGAAPA